MGTLPIIFKRELLSYFATPLDYICRSLVFIPGCISL